VCVFDPNGQELFARHAVEAGIPERIGVISGGAGDRLLTRSLRLAHPDGEGGSDLFDYAVALAVLVGLPEPEPAGVVAPFPFRPEALPELPAPVVAVHPGGAPGWNRRWPLDRYEALCHELVRSEGASLVLIGAAEDAPSLASLRTSVRRRQPQARVEISAGDSLNRLACWLDRADVLVGNDSAPSHIAAAVGTRAVILYGPASREFFWRRIYHGHRAVDHHSVCEYEGHDGGPVTMPCRFACHYPFVAAAGPYPACLRSISVEQVGATVIRQLTASRVP
jgi:ADP-heptose:LPS heptosyltransferase